MGKEEVVAVLFHESCYCLGENGGGDAPFFFIITTSCTQF